MPLDMFKLRAIRPPDGLPFKIRRLGHVVLQVTDLGRSLLFYTQALGFKVTEIYSEDLQPGGFAFLRCDTHQNGTICGAMVWAGDAHNSRSLVPPRSHGRSSNAGLSRSFPGTASNRSRGARYWDSTLLRLRRLEATAKRSMSSRRAQAAVGRRRLD